MPKDVVVNALIDPVVIATPDIVPPVTAMLFAFCVDIVPSPPATFCTNAVVAICVVFVPGAAVGASGVPDKVGLTANTLAPEPVSSVSAAAKFAEEGVAKNVATFADKPEIPVDTGKPVQLVRVPEVGVPKTGLIKVGVFANTFAPEPVSSVRAAAKLALEGVAKNVATFAAKPETPVDTGKPVQFVNVPEVGVPSIGVVNVGLVIAGALFNTLLPDPVEVVTPVPPEVTGSAAASVKSVKCVVAGNTFVPLLNTTIVLPAGTATPVPVEFLIVIVSAHPLDTMYCFSIAGTIRFCAPPDVPIKFKRRLRAVCVPLVSIKLSVTGPLENVTSAEPVIAS